MFSRSLICSIKRRGPANWRLHTVRPRASVDWIPVGFAVATWAQPCRFDAGRGQSFREGPKTRSGHNFLLQNGRTCGGCPILLLICLDNNNNNYQISSRNWGCRRSRQGKLSFQLLGAIRTMPAGILISIARATNTLNMGKGIKYNQKQTK